MELITKERNRLLYRTARLIGLIGIGVAAVELSLPGMLPLTTLLYVLLGLAGTAVALVRAGTTSSLWWLVGYLALGLAVLALIVSPVGGDASEGRTTALATLAAGGLAPSALVLLQSMRGIVLLFPTAAATIILVGLSSLPEDRVGTSGLIALGWLLSSLAGYWLASSVPRAQRRIYSIGRAHRAERNASEVEAQRRQSARLLHDTVLATLTLLAHSGVGVNADALRQQAADDARLLRQLRLGATPTPQASGQYNLESEEESPLGQTLESVKQRFGRMGLEVSWHGRGQVLLRSDVLDSFLLALGECLENVRRHSGVGEAHVTITDDENAVRAMVTDSGVGFDIAEIGEGRLGFRESVVGRLTEVGGTVRVFSSPGAGTTVVLEVPRG
jgi:signal transduction histidine kinase